ncbi:MAG TPA: YqgE/AlgH family protein, partial [Polyangiaceae bacterium]|nr:YqgE/AlgH family protein [Polyangiaceae bacterium]
MINGTRAVAINGQTGKAQFTGAAYNGDLDAYVRAAFAGLTPQGMTLPDTHSYRGVARVGGPVSPRSAWLLYRRAPRFEHEGQMDLSDRWAATGARDLVEAISRGEGPQEFRLLLGYAGWAPGQLEAEISAGAWMPAALDESLVFGEDLDDLWQKAYQQLIGVSPFAFSGLKPGLA